MPNLVTDPPMADLPTFSPGLQEKIRRYYRRYYWEELGLPDWKTRVESRLHEERVEKIHFQRAFGKAGDLTGKRFLNVGCGTGGMNLLVAQAGALSYGIELSEEALEICQLKAREVGLPEDTFTHGPAERLPYPDNHFDFVHCLSVLEHVQDIPKVIREIVRVTRPGGLIFIHVPNYWAFSENHYKIFWLPKFPKALARLYLRLRGRPAQFINTLNYTTPSMIKACLRTEPVRYEQARWDCNPASPKSIFLKELFYTGVGVAPGDFWIRKIEPAKPQACGFADFAVSVLVPQPLKYRFLSQEGLAVVAHNAVTGNLDLFSGFGAERYEEMHLQNADSLVDLHTNAATTGRLIKDYFQPGKRLLEIGCGTGFWSGQLLNQIEKAVMNDLSPDMVNAHRKARTPEETTKIEAYHVGTVADLARQLKGTDKPFARIVAISTLHHLEHRDQQIVLLWDCLEPGGQLLFIEPCHNFKRLLRIFRKLITEYRRPYVPATHDFLTLSEVRRWLRQPALHDAHIRALKTTQFPLLGRLARFHSLYLRIDRLLQHLPILRGQGNMLFAVLQKSD